MGKSKKTDPIPSEVVARVARNLKWVRKIKSPSAAQTARDLGLENSNQWTRYENGVRRADLPLVIKFCELYGASLDFIYRDDLTGVEPELRLRLAALHPELVLGSDSQPAKQPPLQLAGKSAAAGTSRKE